MRPCSGALTVLLFASVIGITRWGMLAVMSMALGTGMALVALALFVQHYRQRAGQLWLAAAGGIAAESGTDRRWDIAGDVCAGAVFTVVPVSANGDYIAAGC